MTELDALKEFSGGLLRRVGEYLVWRPLFNQDALVEENNLVRNFSSKGHLVSGNQHRRAASSEVSQEVENFTNQSWVQSTRDLIEQ